MPDVDWNLVTWDKAYKWQKDGDEWSVAWGGSRSHWLGSVYPRISRFLPAARILEIAPGRGRWSQYLIPHCTEFFGVDLSATCVAECKRRFAAASRVQFIKNDGLSLAMIPNESIDFVFSYDSLVHVELDVIREYVWQVAQKLTRTGTAFLHHSNAGSEVSDQLEARAQNRSLSVSSLIVKELIEDCSCKPLIQEEVNWGGLSRIDCMTTFCRDGAFSGNAYKLITNDEFMIESQIVRRYQSPYALE